MHRVFSERLSIMLQRFKIADRASRHNFDFNYMYFNKSTELMALSLRSFESVDMLICADPESFVRGGPALSSDNVFSLELTRGMRIQIPLIAGNHRLTSETTLKWRFARGPTVAEHQMLAWKFCDFSGNPDQYC